MRVALAGLVVVLGVAVVVALAARGDDPDVTAPGADSRRGDLSDLLVETPREVASVCRSAAGTIRVQARCPSAIPVGESGWGRARALDERRCEYLVDVEPGSDGAPDLNGAIYHLLFGGRCGRFDLDVKRGRWPATGYIGKDLRLVGVLPLRPGESGRDDPDRPKVIRRVRVGDREGLLLRYEPQPLTTVHTGHLAVVWNQANAGFAVSGHPSEPATKQQQRRASQALQVMALAMQSLD